MKSIYLIFFVYGTTLLSGCLKPNTQSVEEMRTDKKEATDNDNKIYIVPEKNASPVGGLRALYKHIQKNLKYPEKAIRRGLEGRVFVEFVVEKNGTVNQLRVLKGIGPECDREAMRLIQSFDKWIPGEHHGQVVRVKQSFPVVFKIVK
ncbi:energy transducer TonB [uncultured Microscilla sp.]|uniref:energy transducer TonB n=1 Tax=uncultured Microscilla sp. TaxID=432653 RepID=UPI00261D96BC|nr:energy transducer TonB [uncultured Microscilla sp.]